MQALRIYGGPLARQHVETHGLQAADIGTIPGAAGGPKGLILGPLDRFIFGDWLAQFEPTGGSGGRLHWRLAHGHRRFE